MVVRVVKDWFGRSNKMERLWLLAKIEFKLRYYENKLGLLWALIKPVSDITIYFVAFELIMKQGVPHFVSFLFIGLIMWNFFIESTSGTVQILNTKKYLYEYTNMNKIEIYTSTLFSNSIGFFFNFIMFSLYYNFFDIGTQHYTLYSLYFIPIFINLLLLSLAFSLILSNLYIIVKDISQIWIVVTGLGFWLSPIIFRLETFRHTLPLLEYANPISGIIINARNVLMYAQPPNWNLFVFDFIYTFVLLSFGFFLLNRLGARASEKL